LDIWVGESHSEPQGNYLAIQLNAKIKFQNFIKETCNVGADIRPEKDPDAIRTPIIATNIIRVKSYR
jgi:hypothetical protein